MGQIVAPPPAGAAMPVYAGGVAMPSPVPGLCNNLLITFGVVDAGQMVKLRDWLEFAHGLGCEGTKKSVETVVMCMSNAVEMYHQYIRRSEFLQEEINRLKSEAYVKDQERIASAHNSEDALADANRAHEVMVLNLEDKHKAEADSAYERHRLAEEKLETDLFNLHEELEKVRREHAAAMEAATADFRGTIRALEAQVREGATHMEQLAAENEALRLRTPSTEALQAELARVTAERDRALGQLTRVRDLTTTSDVHEGLFYDRIALDGATCPVFLGTGCVVSMRMLIGMWAQGPGQFDGEVHRAVICPKTREQTFVAPKAQVDFVRGVAEAIGIDVALPLRFEYTMPPRGGWVEFSFYDQIAIASKVCKIFRRRSVDAGDFVIVGFSTMKMVFSLTEVLLDIPDDDGIRFHTRLSFHVQSLMGDANSIMQGRAVLTPGWNPFPNMELV